MASLPPIYFVLFVSLWRDRALAFRSFGCVFLPLQVIAAAAAFFDFVALFSH
jgi:hypothetical protein